jgi:phage shock protein PspC (stress-responsive transcriptional regulator)
MQEPQPSLIARDDTVLGVCAGLAEDFGIDPLWLRIPFAVSLFFNPQLVVGTYLAAGVIVFLTRLIAPNPRLAAPRPAEAAPTAAAAAAPAAAEDETYWEPVPIAA